MNKQEAYTTMQSGEKVTHRMMEPNEYCYIKDGEIHTEEGYAVGTEESVFWKMRSSEAWLEDWAIYDSSFPSVTIQVEMITSFGSFSNWVNKASDRLAGKYDKKERTICIDRNGLVLTCGEDFAKADKDGSFPVIAYRIIRSAEFKRKKVEKLSYSRAEVIKILMDLPQEAAIAQDEYFYQSLSDGKEISAEDLLNKLTHKK